MTRLAAPLLLVAIACSGCGYKLVRYRADLGEVRSVAVELLRNDSFDPGIEYIVSDALRREFLRRGALRLVEDPEAADLVLRGAVRPLETWPRSFDSVVLTLEYEVTVSLDIRVVRRDGSELPLDPRSLRESERYLASADIEAMRKNRQEALRRVSGLLAGRVHDGLYEALVQ